MIPVPRRGFLLGAGGLGLLAAVGGGATLLPGAGTDPGQTGVLLRSAHRLPTPFTQPLTVPAVLRPTSLGPPDMYEITATVSRQEILPGTFTEVWGYRGTFPGPTLELQSGNPVIVRHTNRLPVPTVVHLHGGHTPAASDGFPTDLVLPIGATGSGPSVGAMTGMGAEDPHAVITVGVRDYAYPLTQRAATLWYHDHRMGFTGPGIWKGLAGFALVRDPQEAALGLPDGDRELPLMICDRAFAADASMSYPALDPTLQGRPGVADAYSPGLLGDVILTNGVPWPLAEVPAARHRLRLLNASNARRYRLALSPPPPGGGGLVQIGSDGGLLGAPIARDSVDLAPAERVDVIVDFARYRPGQPVTLINQLGSGSTANVLRFQLTGPAPDDTTIPSRLSDAPTAAPTPALETPVRDFSFRNGPGGWTINGLAFDPTRPDVVIARGTTELWRFTGDAGHPIHAHLNPFLAVSRDGADPPPGDTGWKDTLDLQPHQQAAVLVHFTDHPGRFLLHCHNLEHEDMAMMSTIAIT